MEYYVKDYVIGTSNFPPGMPSGNYRIDTIVSKRFSNTKVGLIQLYGELIRKPAADILWN